MPQMAPLFWNSMMLFSFMCILFNLTKIYFFNNEKNMLSNSNNYFKKLEVNKWSW